MLTKRRVSLSVTAALLVMALAPPAHGEVVSGESLDWLVLSRPHVALATVTGVVEEPPAKAEDWPYRTTQFRLKDALKGEPPEQAVRREPVAAGDGSVAPTEGAEFLLFFDDAQAISYAINLGRPGTRWLDAAYSTDFQVLGDRRAIMEVVNKRVKQLKAAPPNKAAANAANVFTPQEGFLRLDIPGDSPAHQALYAGSSCYLVVPADAEFKPRLLEQLRDPHGHVRAEAAGHLANYPGDDTVAALKPLLNDPDVQEWQETRTADDGRQGRRKITVYPARQAAYETLRRLGADVPKPEGYLEGLNR